MIEISFVINLAYHELKSFKLRDDVRDLAVSMRAGFKYMMSSSRLESEATSVLVSQYNQLMNFHNGNNKKAWGSRNRCRLFYRHLVYNCFDRYIVRGMLIADVLILFHCTARAGDTILYPFSFTQDAASTLWTIEYTILAVSIIVPACFMLYIRLTVRYVFGKTQEDAVGDNHGRMKYLEQRCLDKFRLLTVQKMGLTD